MKRKMINEEGIPAVVRENTDGSFSLIGCRCRHCGFVNFPAIRYCVSCSADDTEEVELSKAGTLYTFTQTMRPVNHMPAGNISSYVDLDDGARILTPIDMPDGDLPVIGERFEIVFRPLWVEDDETEVFGFAARPMGR